MYFFTVVCWVLSLCVWFVFFLSLCGSFYRCMLGFVIVCWVSVIMCWVFVIVCCFYFCHYVLVFIVVCWVFVIVWWVFVIVCCWVFFCHCVLFCYVLSLCVGVIFLSLCVLLSLCFIVIVCSVFWSLCVGFFVTVCLVFVIASWFFVIVCWFASLCFGLFVFVRYPMQWVAYGIMFLTFPSVVQLVRQSFFCQHNSSSETAQQKFMKLCSCVDLHITCSRKFWFNFFPGSSAPFELKNLTIIKNITKIVCQHNSPVKLLYRISLNFCKLTGTDQ